MSQTLHTQSHSQTDNIREFQKHSTITGTVTDTNYCGCYVRDDNSGFTVYYYGNGMKGDRVQLSVRRINQEKGQVTCILESVLEYGDFAV